jgi:hypothetical protein
MMLIFLLYNIMIYILIVFFFLVNLICFIIFVLLLFRLGRLVDFFDLFLTWDEKLELQRKILFGVQSIAKVYSSDSAVGMDGQSQGLDVVASVGSSCKIGKIELDLVPSFIEFHGHGADEGLDFGVRLVVGGSESPFDSFVVQDLDLEAELFFEIFDYHD